MKTSSKDSIGGRFKDYESISRTVLPRRSWMVIRLDGCNFHNWTRGLDRPFSEALAAAMDRTAERLVRHIDHVNMAYVQSDEISLIIGPGNIRSDPWYGGAVQKLVSVTASMATAIFPTVFPDQGAGHLALKGAPTFDSWVFTVPDSAEAANYCIWRQRDATRNSISMTAQSMFSHARLQGVNSARMQEMLFQGGINWNDYPARFKRGGQVVPVTRIEEREGDLIQRHEWRIEPAPHYEFETLHTALLERSIQAQPKETQHA